MKKAAVTVYAALMGFKDYLYRAWVMFVPFHVIRLFFIKSTLAERGKGLLFRDGSRNAFGQKH